MPPPLSTAQVYGPTPDAELHVITCGGTFDRASGTYLSNVVVFSTRFVDLVATEQYVVGRKHRAIPVEIHTPAVLARLPGIGMSLLLIDPLAGTRGSVAVIAAGAVPAATPPRMQ